MKKARIDTPLGAMIAVADEKALYCLNFEDRCELDHVMFGKTSVMDAIEKELGDYFAGRLKEFQTPIITQGTPFQQRVWRELQTIPFGTTCSYRDIAKAIDNPLAVRAVGGANGANQIVIVIPCHRVISAGGDLGGYSSGLERKKWLLAHEVGLIVV